MTQDVPEDIAPLYEALAQAHAAAGDAARAEAVAKQRKRGSLTARERIDRLIDPGTFVEYGQLAHPPGSPEVYADGIVTGVARRAGRPVAIIAYDYTVLGGSQGKLGHAKQERLFRAVEQLACPVICLIEGGGGRAGESSDGAGNGMVDYVLMAQMCGRVPLVGVVLGRAFAGHAALAGLCDVIIARRSAAIGMAGPPLVLAATGKDLSPEEIGSAEMHHAAGSVDILVEDDEEALEAAGRYLDLLAGPVVEDASPAETDAGLRALVPANARRAYDMKKVVGRLVDPGSWLELRAGFGKCVITGIARLGGMSIGVVANQPMHLAGAMDSAGSDKAARFVNLCDRFGLPLLMLVDTPGFMVGPAAEQQALLRHSSRLVVAMAQFRGAVMSILVRKAFGLAFWAMGSRGFSPLLHVAWPTVDFGAMGREGQAELIAKNGADEAARAAILADLRDKGSPMALARNLMVDDVVDPADTRRLLIQTLSACPRPASPREFRPLDTW